MPKTENYCLSQNMRYQHKAPSQELIKAKMPWVEVRSQGLLAQHAASGSMARAAAELSPPGPLSRGVVEDRMLPLLGPSLAVVARRGESAEAEQEGQCHNGFEPL